MPIFRPSPRCVAAFAAFVALELLLIGFVDKPLSLAVREYGANHQAIIVFFGAITDAGLGKWYVASGLFAALFLAFSRRRGIAESLRVKSLAWGQIVGYFFLCTSAAGAVTDVIKLIIGRARPKLLDGDGFYGFHPLTLGADQWHSMPSGHSTTIFAAAFSLMVIFPRLRAMLLAFAITIGLSRIMVNAHFLSDVLAGAAVAWSTNIPVTALFRRFNWVFKQDEIGYNGKSQAVGISQ